MATLCTHCGSPLKDGTRYCNLCGTPVPSYSLKPQVTSSSSSHAAQLDKPSASVPEQIARHVPQHSTRFPSQREPPSWMRELDNGAQTPGKTSIGRQDASNIPQLDFPAPEPQAASNLPLRRPHVKAWERDESAVLLTPPPTSVRVPTRRKSRKPLVITLIALLLLVLAGGIGAWDVLYQPFSVPVVTQPEQTFTSSQLGLSLHYPSVWKSQVDQRTATAHLYDSSHTAQVNIVVSLSHGEDLDQYLRQEADRLAITGQKKATSLSFADALWQQLQGGVLLKGASYTETLLATVHHQQLYIIMFLAPETTYAQEEQLVFSRMRSSFQFLS